MAQWYDLEWGNDIADQTKVIDQDGHLFRLTKTGDKEISAKMKMQIKRLEIHHLYICKEKQVLDKDGANLKSKKGIWILNENDY